ncbi:MAG: insulinase family protein [Alphaproteobacteria bacterium]|jgi:zinc protease|nr:insulinase family protein [Alphaproteobacteria bacterium]
MTTQKFTFDFNSTFKGNRKESALLHRRPLSFGSWPLLMTLALGCAPGYAEQGAKSPPQAAKPQGSHINVQVIKSNKGINAWFVEAHEIPVVSVSIAFKNTGNASDPKGQAGLVQLVSSMLDEGSGDLNSQEFKKLLLQKNIELDISASQDVIRVNFRTVKENVGDAFLVLRTMLSKPRFDPDTLARVKNQILTLLEQSLHDERSVANQKLVSTIYGDHPYGRTTQQIIKEIPNITEAQMRQYMKERLTRDQLLVSAVGDISVDELKKYLDETFGDFPEKAVPSTVKEAPLLNSGKTIVEPLNIPQSLILFSQPGVPRSSPDFYASYVMMKILGDGMLDSRLWNEIREKRGLAYGIDADVKWSQHSTLILGKTATKNQSTKEVIDIIRQVWQDMLKGATQTEVDFVKKRLMGSFALIFSSTKQISNALLTYQLDNLGSNYINERNAILSKLTLEDINRAAKSLLKPENLTFIVVGEPKGLSSLETAKEATKENKVGAKI